MIRMLVADPDSTARKALARLIERRLGLACIDEAGEVETLIRAFADAPPDVLLLDWSLQGSAAPEICGLLQKAFPDLRIVLLSVDRENEGAATAAGARFIHKGASPDELIETLKPLLAEETK